MRMKKENDRRNHVGTTFEMAFDTTPKSMIISL